MDGAGVPLSSGSFVVLSGPPDGTVVVPGSCVAGITSAAISLGDCGGATVAGIGWIRVADGARGTGITGDLPKGIRIGTMGTGTGTSTGLTTVGESDFSATADRVVVVLVAGTAVVVVGLATSGWSLT